MRNKIELDQLQQAMSASKLQLAALWGRTSPDFDAVEGKLDIISVPPDLNELKVKLSKNIDLIRLMKEIEYLRSVHILEKAFRIPDPSISSGIKHMNESGIFSFQLGISIPIPLSDKNQGNIKTSKFLVEKAEFILQEKKIIDKNELSALYKRLKNNYKNALLLKKTILPKAAESFDVIYKGYERGKFTYLSVLDAYRTQLELREEHLLTLLKYHHILIDIERLTGLGIKQFISKKK
jgi:cobalt-zinc-cadmium efflux system outer membrane protein